MSACDLIVIGGSWGGIQAVGALLAILAPMVTPPIAVALHRAPDSGDALLRVLTARAGRAVCDALDKDPIESGRVYVAPANYHLHVEPGYFALSIDEPVAFSRPSIDLLFESAADAYGAGVVGVLLTGTGQDGSAGLARIKRRGGLTLVQDPATAERGAMPAAAIAAGAADAVLSLEGIGRRLIDRCGLERR